MSYVKYINYVLIDPWIPYHLRKSHLRKTFLRKPRLSKIDCANLVCANFYLRKTDLRKPYLRKHSFEQREAWFWKWHDEYTNWPALIFFNETWLQVFVTVTILEIFKAKNIHSTEGIKPNDILLIMFLRLVKKCCKNVYPRE